MQSLDFHGIHNPTLSHEHDIISVNNGYVMIE